NINSNTNINSNVRTATPSPTPRPSPTASPSPTATRTPEDDADSPTPARTPTPVRTPFPTPSPIIIRPGQTPPSNRTVNSGVLNGRATRLPSPSYPSIARQARASGQVAVEVSVDERGNIVSARAISGHLLLRPAAESAARQSKINPARIDNQNVRSTGVLLYNFRSN
ncbi:MAG: TonB family protein, partial [Pyrinomonadaceae bacterium]